MLEIKGVGISHLLGNIFFACKYIMCTVLLTKISYRGNSEFGEERKISKFYRALVTGILDNDEVPTSTYLSNTLFWYLISCSDHDPLLHFTILNV